MRFAHTVSTFSPRVLSLSLHNCATAMRDFVPRVRTAVRDFVRAYERDTAPSAANDNNNGCNEFKQFCIAECPASTPACLPPPPFSREQNLSVRSRSRRYRPCVLMIDVQKCSTAVYSIEFHRGENNGRVVGTFHDFCKRIKSRILRET